MSGNPQDVSAIRTLTVNANQVNTATLALTTTPPPPPTTSRPFRRVTIQGQVYIKDHENFGDNETQTHSLSGSVVLDPVGKRTHTFSFSHCTGGEVRVETTVFVSLNPTDNSVATEVHSKLFEGDSCGATGTDDDQTGSLALNENGRGTIGVHLTNAYAFGDDEARVTVTVLNERNTVP